jgi:hypothetical protein
LFYYRSHLEAAISERPKGIVRIGDLLARRIFQPTAMTAANSAKKTTASQNSNPARKETVPC